MNALTAAAARDAAARARSDADALDALARLLDASAASPTPQPLSPAPQPLAQESGLWTVRDAAKHLKVSRSWLYRAAACGTVPVVRIGALIRFEPRRVCEALKIIEPREADRPRGSRRPSARRLPEPTPSAKVTRQSTAR